MENAQPSESGRAIRDRNFISRAKEQLEADHYGLDKIKRRLIEYLAIIRLHQLAADAELKAEEAKRASQEAQATLDQLRGDQDAKVCPEHTWKLLCLTCSSEQRIE